MADIHYRLAIVDGVNVSKTQLRDGYKLYLAHYMTKAELRATSTFDTRAVVVGGDVFLFDSLDTTSADNDVDILVSADGDRYKRQSANFPLTTKGDLLVRGAAVPARLPVGTDGQVLVADALEALGVKWTAATPLTTKGDLLSRTTTGLVRVPVGADGRVLAADSAQPSGLAYIVPGSLLRVVTFSASGTWTKGAGTTKVIVELVGGGGAGGSTSSSGTGNAAASGGSAGGYARKFVDVTAIASELVTVGAGGAPGAAGFNPGGNGGTSSFGAHCSATGGAGGDGATEGGIAYTEPTTGGIGSNGDINARGASGGAGISIGVPTSLSGFGAPSFFGGGGRPIVVDTSANGIAAETPGAGGSGGASQDSGSTQGGAGAAGLVVVYEFA